MGKKKEYVVHTKNVPLRDRGILAKPMSRKELELDKQIEAGVKYLQDNPSVSETVIDLYSLYKAYVNSRMPGIEEAAKVMVHRVTSSLRLTIKANRGSAMTAQISQKYYPCPFPASKVKSFNPRFHADLEPLFPDDTQLIVDGKPVTNRLVVSMDYDLSRPAREQILEFSSESQILATQYCVFRSTRTDDDDPTQAAAA